MKTVTYVCDRCNLPIDGKTTPVEGNFHGIGDAHLITIERTSGGWGHNGIPNDGWHFHYYCFTAVSEFVNTKKP